MAELQISVVTNDNHRSQIVAQIRHWEDTLERLFCEQFRLRCYMASLQNGELPNPKGVLQKVNQVCYNHISFGLRTQLPRVFTF